MLITRKHWKQFKHNLHIQYLLVFLLIWFFIINSIDNDKLFEHSLSFHCNYEHWWIMYRLVVILRKGEIGKQCGYTKCLANIWIVSYDLIYCTRSNIFIQYPQLALNEKNNLPWIYENINVSEYKLNEFYVEYKDWKMKTYLE